MMCPVAHGLGQKILVERRTKPLQFHTEQSAHWLGEEITLAMCFSFTSECINAGEAMENGQLEGSNKLPSFRHRAPHLLRFTCA